MPLTGSLHLWKIPENQEKTEAFRIKALAPKEGTEDFFREIFKQQNMDFEFESVRSSKNEFTFRPSSRVHYVAVQEGDELVFTKIDPAWNRRLMELHKGHGPILMRWLESAFGVALILVTLSGIWLSLTAKAYRKVTVISFLTGLAVILACLF